MKAPRLTPFQKLMSGWAQLAPYNFIHALRLQWPADAARWRAAAEETLRPLGFAPPEVVIESSSVEPDVRFTAELHRPFAPDAPPLRFFVLDPGGAEHWLGVTIDHWIADDFACRALLERMIAGYRGSPLPPLQWERPSSRRAGLLTGWRAFAGQASALRRAVRTPLRDPADLRVETFRVVLRDGALPAIRALAKRQHATVHDVFLAAAAQTFGAAHAPAAGARRDAVALTSAVNLRRFERSPVPGGFGLMTGEYSVIEPRPHEAALPELVRRIAEQTRRLKNAPGTDHLGPALLLWRLTFSRRAKATLFHRGSPYAAGLSNVNLTGTRAEAAGIADYRRVGPCGPVVPVVLIITTWRGRISIDVTFRTTAYSQARAGELLRDFAARLPPNPE